MGTLPRFLPGGANDTPTFFPRAKPVGVFFVGVMQKKAERVFESPWLIAALWGGLALAASLISIRLAISVASDRTNIGAVTGDAVGLGHGRGGGLPGPGRFCLTFLNGAEIDPVVVRKHFWASISRGRLFARFRMLAYAPLRQRLDMAASEIAGIALSTTWVAVVYAVMVETGFNRTEMGKLILAAVLSERPGNGSGAGVDLPRTTRSGWRCLGAMVVVLCLLPKFSPWFFAKVGNRVSEVGKFILLVLFGLGGLGNIAKSEAVVPLTWWAWFLAILPERASPVRTAPRDGLHPPHPVLFPQGRFRVKSSTVVTAFALIAILLGVKMLTKFAISGR